MWIDHDGECILQSLSQEPETKLEECHKTLESHIHPTSQFRVARHCFLHLQQEKSKPIEFHG